MILGNVAQQKTTNVINDLTDWDNWVGTPWTGDNIGNVPIGRSSDDKRSIRFRAKHTGQIEGMRFHFISQAGTGTYSDGTGGVIRIRLYPDNGNDLPDTGASHLGEVTHTPNLVNGGLVTGDTSEKKIKHFPFILLSATVVKNTLYHVVFENIDANPTDNFLSINALGNSRAGNLNQGPRMSIQDFGYCKNTNNTGWEESTNHTSSLHYQPMIEIRMTGWESNSSLVYGNGIIDSYNTDYRSVVGANDKIRTIFTGDKTLTASTFWLRGWVEGDNNTTGDLRITLTGDDASSETIDIPASTFISYITANAGTGTTRNADWISVPWVVTINLGVEYTMLFEAINGGDFNFQAMRNFSAFGMVPDAYFNGVTKHTDDNGTTYSGWHDGNTNAGWDQNRLQMAFRA